MQDGAVRKPRGYSEKPSVQTDTVSGCMYFRPSVAVLLASEYLAFHHVFNNERY